MSKATEKSLVKEPEEDKVVYIPLKDRKEEEEERVTYYMATYKDVLEGIGMKPFEKNTV